MANMLKSLKQGAKGQYYFWHAYKTLDLLLIIAVFAKA